VTGSATAASYFAKAERALASAKTLLRENETEGACNRAYYAMFAAAHVALWVAGARRDGSVIKTHGGLVAAFGDGVVKSGKLAPRHGRALARVLKARLMADYSAGTPEIADANEIVILAESFLTEIRARFLA
jgi:uncharacterized protein (UPF0332 family)